MLYDPPQRQARGQKPGGGHEHQGVGHGDVPRPAGKQGVAKRGLRRRQAIVIVESAQLHAQGPGHGGLG